MRVAVIPKAHINNTLLVVIMLIHLAGWIDNMKKLLLTALIFTAPVLADVECETRKKLAKDIMLERQTNKMIAPVLKRYKDQGASENLKFMLIGAYNYPYIDTDAQFVKAVKTYGTKLGEQAKADYELMIASKATLAERFAKRAYDNCMRSKGK